MMNPSTTVPIGGGSSVFEASLSETLSELSEHWINDLVLAGFTERDLVRIVATTPPFSEALAHLIRRQLRPAR